MSMVVGTNIAALNTTRNLNLTNNKLSSSLEKLSSGYRINSGKDAPADLVISEQLRSQKNGLERAVRNTNEANNVLSIAEGALNEANNILKTMKALAIHAANEGVTSTDQIEADQAEMDSAIQTLERIANTTKYSNLSLLNGAQDITYNIDTEIKGTQNNQLLTGDTTFQQIYKTNGYAVTIGFTGTTGTNLDKASQIGDADMSKQAMKAYLEIDPVSGSLSQVNEDGVLTQSQSFILTGNKGSRQFSFAAGTSVDQIVSAIHLYADSTGIDASLVFNSDQTINYMVASGGAAALNTDGLISGYNIGQYVVFDNVAQDSNGDAYNILTSVSGAITGLQYGLNTDGQGNIYVKITGENTYELYKDASMSEESLIGVGSNTGGVKERNNSGIGGLNITVNSADAKYGDVAIISTGGILLSEVNSGNTSGNVHTGGICNSSVTSGGSFNMENSVAVGVQLGTNTDAAGKVYLKVVTDSGGLSTVYAYNDSSMSNSSLVAKSEEGIDLSTVSGAVTLSQVWNSEHTASTGLNLVLSIGSAFTEAGTQTGEFQFANLGARVYSSDYGSDAFIQVQQIEGGIFTYYDQADSASSATLIEAKGTSSTTVRVYGQDATVNINGQQFKTTGLKLDMATSDIMAKMVFNEGKTGTTTIAQVGYGEGSVFSKCTSLTFSKADLDGTYYQNQNQYFSALLNNACHNTKETVKNFDGGMQLQLGETSGDQDRTVIAIKSMAIDNLGRITVTKNFDSSNAVMETKTLSVRDIMGGQIASLSQDPNLAMQIIEQAIDDVTSLRAQIGAVQANMLETNANNLEVAIENITKTESAIRDTDMASEMTEFTSAQILSNAGVSMLAQANTQAQNVLQLLR